MEHIYKDSNSDTPSASKLDQREQLYKKRLLRNLGFWINFCLFIFPLIIGWLSLSDLPKVVFDSGITDWIFNFSLILYLFSWCFGLRYDLKDEFDYILYAPNHGRMNLKMSFFIFSMILFFLSTLLLSMYKLYNYASLFLLAVLILNFAYHLYLLRISKPLLEESVIKYQSTGQIYNLISLRIIKYYLFGKWQYYRFLVAAVIIISINLVYHVDFLRHFIIFFSGKFSMHETLILNSLVLTYIIVIESWVWYQRVKRYWQIYLLENMQINYSISDQDH